MIQILQLPLGPLQTNCYVLACEETLKAAVIEAIESASIGPTIYTN